MEIIAHRINTLKELKSIPSIYGVELDLRDDFSGRIYIQHNPFEPGEDFENYLKEYHHGTMILNIKSERIEYKVRELIAKYNVKSYFFLDSSFPMIYSLSKEGEKNIAIRVSEVEGIDTAVKMAGRINWIWVDCFSRFPISNADYKVLKDCGYKLCFVSPDLVGRPNDISKYIEQIKNENIVFDAICVKCYNALLWEELL